MNSPEWKRREELIEWKLATMKDLTDAGQRRVVKIEPWWGWTAVLAIAIVNLQIERLPAWWTTSAPD